MKLQAVSVLFLLSIVALLSINCSSDSPSSPSGGTVRYYSNWTCNSQGSCISVMGANYGSAGPFCTLTDCENWNSEFIPGSSSCGTSAQYTILNAPPAGTCQTWGGSGSGATSTFTPNPSWTATPTPTINLLTITPTKTNSLTKTNTPNPSWTATLTPTLTFTTTLTPTGTITPNNFVGQLSYSSFSSPYGLAVDHSGHLFVSQRGGTVYKFDGIGASSPSATLVISGAVTLNHVAVDANGYVYIAEANPLTVVWKYDNDLAGTVSPVTFAAGLEQPSGVAVDSAGDVYASDVYHLDSLYFVTHFNPQATPVATYTNGSSPTWGAPNGIALNTAATGEYLACANYIFFSPIPSGANVKDTVTNNPQGAAVDPVSGDVYFADTGNNRVLRYSASMVSKGTVGSGFSGPTDVAVDPDGNIYVLDSGNKRIMAYSP